MPYRSVKIRGKKCYRVFNSQTKKVFANCTTRAKATKQLRLLRAIQNNPSFVSIGRRRRKTLRKRK
jgi:hypothetical protein